MALTKREKNIRYYLKYRDQIANSKKTKYYYLKECRILRSINLF